MRLKMFMLGLLRSAGSTDFLEPIKLTYYVDCESELELVRKLRRHAEINAAKQVTK